MKRILRAVADLTGKRRINASDPNTAVGRIAPEVLVTSIEYGQRTIIKERQMFVRGLLVQLGIFALRTES